eukprot:11453026-Heterocapsa_arctica.AAC.1
MDLLEAHDVAFRVDPMKSLPSLADPNLRGLDRREDSSRIPSRNRQRGPRKIKSHTSFRRSIGVARVRHRPPN